MRDIILKILEEKLGNIGHDLYLAERSFRGMTKLELDVEHGKSGLSHKDVLNDYKVRVDKVKKCIEWVKNVQVRR